MKRTLRTVLLFAAAGLIIFPASALLANRQTEKTANKKEINNSRRNRPQRFGDQRRRRPQLMEEMFTNLNIPAEERERLKKLAAENPAAFRKEIFKRMEQERKKQMDELLALRKVYLNAPAGAEKEKAKEALRKRIEDNIKRHTARSERRIRTMEKQLEQFQKRVNAARAQHEKMKAGQGAILEKILNDFTNPDKEPTFHPPRKERK